MSIRNKVQAILQTNEKARNSDLELYITYLEDICETPEEKHFIRYILEKAGTNLAGLTRERAYIQNTLGIYLSNKKIKKIREEREAEMTEEYSSINKGTRY